MFLLVVSMVFFAACSNEKADTKAFNAILAEVARNESLIRSGTGTYSREWGRVDENGEWLRDNGETGDSGNPSATAVPVSTSTIRMPERYFRSTGTKPVTHWD